MIHVICPQEKTLSAGGFIVFHYCVKWLSSWNFGSSVDKRGIFTIRLSAFFQNLIQSCCSDMHVITSRQISHTGYDQQCLTNKAEQISGKQAHKPINWLKMEDVWWVWWAGCWQIWLKLCQSDICNKLIRLCYQVIYTEGTQLATHQVFLKGRWHSVIYCRKTGSPLSTSQGKSMSSQQEVAWHLSSTGCEKW